MTGLGGKRHPRKHDMSSSIDHKGDIYDALVGALNALTAANVAVDTKTMTDAIAAAIVGMSWQTNVIRFEAMVTNEPVGPSDGDRYISTEAGNIPSTVQAVLVDDVCEWDSGTSLWVITSPQDGWAVIEDGVDPNIAWWYSGTQWRKLGTIVDHANLLNLNWSVAAHVMDIDLDMATHKITNVVDPVANQDVSTKKYVDDEVGENTKDISCYANQKSGTNQVIEDSQWTPAVLDEEQKDTDNMHKTTNEDSGTATGLQTASTLMDNTKTWGVNAYQNMWVFITGGLGIGQIRKIPSNTLDTLTITPNWATTPDATTTYEIIITTRITLTKNGPYLIIPRATYSGDGGNAGVRGIGILINGVSITRALSNPVGTQISPTLLPSFVYDGIIGDFIEMETYQTRGSSLALASSPGRVYLQVVAQRGVS